MQLEQLVTNLEINAAHAMGNQGYSNTEDASYQKTSLQSKSLSRIRVMESLMTNVVRYFYLSSQPKRKEKVRAWVCTS